MDDPIADSLRAALAAAGLGEEFDKWCVGRDARVEEDTLRRAATALARTDGDHRAASRLRMLADRVAERATDRGQQASAGPQ